MKLNKPYKIDLGEEEWLRQRKLFITATEASALMGVNPYVTPSKLLREKPLPPTKLISPYLDRGLENEQAVLDTASEWLEGELAESQGFYAFPETRISATPDGILADGRMIEAKCTGMRNLSRWNQFPPIYYIMQCQVQMYVVGAKENFLHARFFYDWPNETCEAGADRMYKIEYNEEIIEICIDKVRQFWQALEDGTSIRNNKEETEYHTNLLKSTCEMYRGHIIMKKFEIEPMQLSIIRQTCLKAAAKMCPRLPTDSVIEFAHVIEEKIFYDIAKGCEDNSRNFLIQIGACVNGYAEGKHEKNLDIHCLRHFVVESLKYITRK